MDCLVPFPYPDGEEAVCTMQYRVWPVIQLGERRHMAVAMNQDRIGDAQRVRDGFRSLLVLCGVVAGLGPAGGLADGRQLLLKGPLGGMCVRGVGGQL